MMSPQTTTTAELVELIDDYKRLLTHTQSKFSQTKRVRFLCLINTVQPKYERCLNELAARRKRPNVPKSAVKFGLKVTDDGLVDFEHLLFASATQSDCSAAATTVVDVWKSSPERDIVQILNERQTERYIRMSKDWAKQSTEKAVFGKCMSVLFAED